MKKIISLFKRNYEGNRLVIPEVVEGAEWVINGEGVATVKIDGTCCLIKNRILYKRYDAKRGKQPPAGFTPAQDPDEKTGHWPGWLRIDVCKPEDKWHWEGLNWLYNHTQLINSDGTYELIGPKIQGNPYNECQHKLIKHGSEELFPQPPRDFEGLKEFLTLSQIEGIVWWRDINDPDCEKVKLKRRDFGLEWPIKRW